MTWPRQVLHVAASDIRHLWWLLLIYALAVAMAAAASAGVLPPAWGMAGMLFVLGAGIIVLASLIQSDPPSRTDAAWVTWPLEWSAVLGAKLLLAAVFLVIPGLIGQAVVIAAHDVPLPEIWSHLIRSAGAYGGFLLFIGLLAVLTRSLASLLLAGMAVLFLSQVLFMAAGPPREVEGNALMTVGSVIAMLALMAWQYRSFDRRRVAGVAGLVLVCQSLAIALVPAQPAVADRVSSALPVAAHVPVRVGIGIAQPATDHVRLFLRLDTTAGPYRYTLVSPRVVLTSTAGAIRDLEVLRPIALSTPRLTFRGELEAVNDPNPSDHSLRLPVSRAEQAALRSGEAWLQLTARLEVQEPEVLEILPLSSSSTFVGDGLRLRVSSAAPIRDGLYVQSSRILPQGVSSDDMPGVNESFFFALVNRTSATGGLVRLQRRSTSGRTFGPVIPGVQMAVRAGELEPDVRFHPGLRDSPRWQSGGDFLIGRWVARGSYPISVAVRVGP